MQATDDMFQETEMGVQALSFPDTASLVSTFARLHPAVIIVDPPAALSQVQQLVRCIIQCFTGKHITT